MQGQRDVKERLKGFYQIYGSFKDINDDVLDIILA